MIDEISLDNGEQRFRACWRAKTNFSGDIRIDVIGDAVNDE